MLHVRTASGKHAILAIVPMPPNAQRTGLKLPMQMEVIALAPQQKTHVMSGTPASLTSLHVVEPMVVMVETVEKAVKVMPLSSPNSAQSPSLSLPRLRSEPILACQS